MAELKGELKDLITKEIAKLRLQTTEDMAELKDQTAQDIAEVKEELKRQAVKIDNLTSESTRRDWDDKIKCQTNGQFHLGLFATLSDTMKPDAVCDSPEGDGLLPEPLFAGPL